MHTPPRSLARRWSATTAPYLLLRGSGQAAEFLGWVILARRLGAETFGTVSIAVLVCRYGGLLADWGASIRGVRDIAEERHAGELHVLERRRQLTTGGLAVLYIGGAIATGHQDLVPMVAMLVSLGLNRDWIALGREQGGRAALPVFMQGTILLTAATVVTAEDPALPAAAGYSAALVVSVALNRLPPIAGGTRLRTDAWMLLALLANQVLSSADTLMVAAIAGVESAGIYAAVYRLPNAWLALLVILRSGLLPLATRARHGSTADFLALRRASLRWSTGAGVALALSAPLVFVLVPVVFGPAYEAGRLPAALLVASTAVATAAAPLHHLFLAFGEDRPYALYLLGAAASNLALNLALIPRFDMVGAALATVGANVVLAVLLWRAMLNRVRTLAP